MTESAPPPVLVEQPPARPSPRPSFARRHATVLKLIAVGILAILMLVPLAMIGGVLSERLGRRNEAVAEITASWGEEQSVIGPLLGVPYRYRVKSIREVLGKDGKLQHVEVEETEIGNAYFLPEVLDVAGDVQTQMLHRGIYEAAVYRAQLTLSGSFAAPDFAALEIEPADIVWEDAFVTFAASDMRGTHEGLTLKWGGVERPLSPGSQIPGYTTGATAMLSGSEPMSPIAADVPFSLALDLNGSGGVSFAPFGVQNTVTLQSNWPDPSFGGAFLPSERTVRADGFNAKWRVSYYGRDYPQRWKTTGTTRFSNATVDASLFGVRLAPMLETYRFVERSIKYGALFFVLVFTTFFFFEVTARQRIHPLQYIMVGAALCLFYLLLLSISEFLGFGWAYAIAATASTLLITWYCRHFLGGGARTLTIGAGLAAVYGFLYVTLRQQDYALLMGAVALFLVLALVMFVTRKIDWYARDAG